MILYDCEIINCVPMKDETNDPKYSYCKGWGDKTGMGISVICAYDYFEKRFRVFLEDNFDKFQKLINDRPYIGGFNSKLFDDALIRANNFNIPFEKCFDVKLIIQDSFKNIGVNTKIGYSQDNLCKLNGLQEKTDNGAFAPRNWQDKKYGNVIDYCLNDVKMLKQLMDMILLKKEMTGPTGKSMIIEHAALNPILSLIK